MLNRVRILQFVVTGFLLGATVLIAQSSSPTLPPPQLRLPPLSSLRQLREIPTPQVVYMPIGEFQLLNSSTGWVESDDNQLLWTTDGGAHWKDISPPNPNGDSYADVFFVDQVTGWVLFTHQCESPDDPLRCNPESDWTFYVAATQDGGQTWTTTMIPALRSGNRSVQLGGGEIVFGDRLNGWIALGHSQTWGDLLHTSDGGIHWEWVKNYPGIAGAICAAGPDRLFVEGLSIDAAENQLYGTWDAGQTFQNISLAPSPATGKAHDPTYGCPQFVDPQTGYETVLYDGGDNVPSAAVLFKTTDGGHTWKPLHTFGNLIDSEGITSDVAGSNWVIYFSHKGHLSLIQLPLSPGFTPAPPHQMGDLDNCSPSFWGSTYGWESCTGYLSTTDDGGATWTVINPRMVYGTGDLTDAPITPPQAAPSSPSPTSTIPRWK